jgi:hypothetical protein
MTTVFEKLRKEAHAFAVASDEVVGRKDIVYRDKFNELIVKECCEVLRMEVEVALSADGTPVYPEGLIRKHFGVEE